MQAAAAAFVPAEVSMKFPSPRHRTASTGQQVERVDVTGSHSREMPVIEGCEPSLTESLHDRQHGAVDESDPQVLVRPHQLGGARMIGGSEMFDVELAAGYRVQEGREGFRSQLTG